ncbi:uncharacterized protein LOC114530813 [Dendronephthya gigantea]|uniref:uncharacterized protein LOC114530813 n=1 Tax=Dendronephthya gigantea TaxID=151771 RepID=UPI00106A8A9E|nr:uncharacterized protein LOC114530813 [Dendronephthya gigantea]
MGLLKKLDEEIQNVLCEGDSSEEVLLEDIESAAKVQAEMQEAVLMIEEVLQNEDTTSESLNTSQQSQQAPSVATGTSSRARLPKLKVKKFSGRIHEWQEFWDSFKSAIHNNANLSDVDKFSYLRGLIEGPARATIAGFSLTEENYNSAVEHLERRFGKPVAIERAHVSELLKVAAVHSERDVRGLRTLYDIVETHYRGLSALGVDENTYSGIVVPILLEKIPDTVRLTITRGKEYLNWTVNDMLKALLAEVELREDYRLTPTAKPLGSGGRRDQFSANGLHVNRDDRCAFCMGKHSHENCKRVTDLKERKTIIRKFGRCFKCLEKGHCARDCRTGSKCKNCKGGHHTAMCEAKMSRRNEEEPAQDETEAGQETTCTLVESNSRIALLPHRP